MAANKIAVIIRHEFFTRIRSKAFLLATLLAPLGMLVMILVPVISTMLAEDSAKSVAVRDPSHNIAQALVQEDSTLFFASDLSVDSLNSLVKLKRIAAYLVVPADIQHDDTTQLFSGGGGGLKFYGRVEDAVRTVVRRERMAQLHADSAVLALLNRSVPYDTKKISEKGIENDRGEALALVGYVLGFLIYMMMFIYGGVVMRAVLEEKTNRIVEVIASSATPFEIMLGKIIGVGAMGLVQIVLWIVMSYAIGAIAAPVVQSLMGADAPTAAQAMSASAGVPPAVGTPAAATPGFSMPSISPWIIIAFVFYFISGYFLYASLFAGVAAGADQEQDMQSLQLPITLPLIIPMLFIGNIISNPDGTLATVLSMIPFFTPVLMIVRIAATEVPLWQIIVSTVMLIATFIGAVWAAGRVYRVGILSYGKKASFRDMAKWLLKA